MAKASLDETYNTFALTSAARMFKLTEKITPDLILLDLYMPEMDGFEALSILKADPKLKRIPVIFLTASIDPEAEIRGFEMGAVDFITKPFSPSALVKRIQLHIEMDLLVKHSLKAVKNIHNATMGVIANVVENRDRVTGKHIERTQTYIDILVNELICTGVYESEISKWDLSLVIPSALLHDAGKICISDVLLNKPGKLTPAEFEVVKGHCLEGERIIDEIISNTEGYDNGFLQYAKRFAGYHHEKWDGSGYPRGLSGEDIPLEGRIMAIADVYDALVSVRPYKEAMPHDAAVNILREGSGTHFDPKLIKAFLQVADDFWVETVRKGVQ